METLPFRPRDSALKSHSLSRETVQRLMSQNCAENSKDFINALSFEKHILRAQTAHARKILTFKIEAMLYLSVALMLVVGGKGYCTTGSDHHPFH